jgi:hypothetical protein
MDIAEELPKRKDAMITKSAISTYPVKALAKHQINQFLVNYRMLTGKLRVAPDFIIIGAQRCGTTSLYNNLNRHLCVAPALKKEIHFFDVNFDKGTDWYRAHFPSYLYRYVRKVRDQRIITGEASPYYLFHPHVPKRVVELFPRIKLIALLRNPIDRAYSHYNHEVRKGFEKLPFLEAIEKEPERLLVDAEKMQEDENYYSFNHRHYSYLSRGIYVDQLKNWMRFFSREQILILKSEDFYSDPGTVMSRLQAFLKLPGLHMGNYGRYNYHPYAELGAAMRTHLINYFRLHNQELYEYLGMDFGWNI